MLDQVTIRARDRGASERFFDTVLAVLDRPRSATGEQHTEWGDFSVAQADAEHPPTLGLHIGFAAGSSSTVDAFWRAGIEAGYSDDGRPGLRPVYGPQYYGGFLLDPDGNSVEALHDEDRRRPGAIDHLWIRVADLAAARAFYVTIAPHTGFRVGHDGPGRVQLRTSECSISLVPGDQPTEQVHVAFGAPDNAAVDRFHAAATAAGYRDNGAPGERPEYHAGYYGAFVLDPDGNNVELVDHGRR